MDECEYRGGMAVQHYQQLFSFFSILCYFLVCSFRSLAAGLGERILAALGEDTAKFDIFRNYCLQLISGDISAINFVRLLFSIFSKKDAIVLLPGREPCAFCF